MKKKCNINMNYRNRNGYCKFCGMKLLENGMCPNFSCVSNGFIL